MSMEKTKIMANVHVTGGMGMGATLEIVDEYIYLDRTTATGRES